MIMYKMGNSNIKARNDFNRVGNALNPHRNGTSSFFGCTVQKIRAFDQDGSTKIVMESKNLARESNLVFSKTVKYRGRL